MKLYSMTPQDGETEIVELTAGWKGFRVRPTTAGFAEQEAGAWQFQIIAADDWETSQAEFREIVALTVGTRRWKVTKVEEPIGESLVWKLRAETQ